MIEERKNAGQIIWLNPEIRIESRPIILEILRIKRINLSITTLCKWYNNFCQTSNGMLRSGHHEVQQSYGCNTVEMETGAQNRKSEI